MIQKLCLVRTKEAARSYIFNWFGGSGRNLDQISHRIAAECSMLVNVWPWRVTCRFLARSSQKWPHAPVFLIGLAVQAKTRIRYRTRSQQGEQSCSVPRAALASLLHILCLVRTKEAARSYIFKWFAGSGPKPEPGSALDCRGVP